MTKFCKQCSVQFEVADEDMQFYDKVSPVIRGVKYPVSAPTLCPNCRLQRRLVWRNEKRLYRNKCAETGKEVISWIAPDKLQKVYCKDAWWSDSWDARDYGRDFDFEKPFFDQLAELIKEVPWMDLLVDKTFNSDYVNYCNNAKDCYLIYASNNNESCMYSSYIWDCNDCIDCLQAFDCELCYACMDVNNCYGCKNCKNCTNCTDCSFCENCQGCNDCFGCVNLINKKYCYLNKQLSKDEYEQKLKDTKLDSCRQVQKVGGFFSEHRLKFPMRYAQIINCENCTGNAIRNSSNTQEGYDSSEVEDSKWVMIGNEVKDCYDISGCDGLELCYDTVVAGLPATRVMFSAYTWKGVSEMLYCILSPGSQNCFGCVGLHKGKYCILNKQYTKEQYEELVPRIIEHMIKTGEWGEFLPVNLSPFDYNETIANDHFPMTKEEVLAKGWRWREIDEKEYMPTNYEVPDSINEVGMDILSQVCACGTCGKNYRIIEPELKFYKRHNIPAPKKCSDCRHDDRMSTRNPNKLYARNCDKCGAKIQTTYSPDKPETVYCADCYLETVY